jgi:4'-phosphopantetheinyl transferase
VLALPDDEVHVYWLETDGVALDERWLPLLSPEERERHGRFVFEKDRRLFLLAHVLTRSALAQYVGSDPAGLEFAENEYGKPRLVARPGAPCPGFNLSHTHGMVAVAIANEAELGVDVEDSRRAGNWEGIQRTVFTDAEREHLQGLPSEHQKERFYELWTLKEAYLKARGMGFSLPLDGFSMRISDGRPIGIEFTRAIADHPAEWQFELFAMATCRLAVAIRAPGGKKWTVRLLAGESGLAAPRDV